MNKQYLRRPLCSLQPAIQAVVRAATTRYSGCRLGPMMVEVAKTFIFKSFCDKSAQRSKSRTIRPNLKLTGRKMRVCLPSNLLYRVSPKQIIAYSWAPPRGHRPVFWLIYDLFSSPYYWLSSAKIVKMNGIISFDADDSPSTFALDSTLYWFVNTI